jgi:hypothetical protein
VPEAAESISTGCHLDTLSAELSRLNRLVEFDSMAFTVADFEQGVVRVHILARIPAKHGRRWPPRRHRPPQPS